MTNQEIDLTDAEIRAIAEHCGWWGVQEEGENERTVVD